MRERVVRRAVTIAAALTIAAAAVTTADTVMADGDLIADGFQGIVDLGAVAPGATIEYDVSFFLSCSSSNHVNQDQTVTLTVGPLGVPAEGGSVGATSTTIGPPGASWPLDRDACGSAAMPIASNAPSRVTIVAPPVDGRDYLFQVGWTRSFSPVSSADGVAVSGLFTFVSFTLDVVSNTPPVLILPTSVTQEGDTTSGATAAYAFGATDAEDEPDPAAACTPAPGDFVPLGTTRIECSVTDSGGMTARGGFDLTVVDTTPPVLAGVPAGLDIVTADSNGVILAFDLPTAGDVVDAAPTVACDPAPGATAPVGDSTVTCTATDASGNAASATFPVRVALMIARWEAPIGGNPARLDANHGRTIPVKLVLLDGATERRDGAVGLRVRGCDGGEVLAEVDLAWTGGRWLGHLDTSRLPAPGCYTVMASLDGGAGPFFRLDLRGPADASAHGGARRP